MSLGRFQFSDQTSLSCLLVTLCWDLKKYKVCKDTIFLILLKLLYACQMLSMRNGLSLHPMCLPDGVQPIQLSQMRMEFGVGNRSQPLNMTGTPTATRGASTSSLFGLPNQCSVSNQELVSNMINSETSFGLESSIQTHLRPLDLQTGPEVGLLLDTYDTFKVKKE